MPWTSPDVSGSPFDLRNIWTTPHTNYLFLSYVNHSMAWQGLLVGRGTALPYPGGDRPAFPGNTQRNSYGRQTRRKIPLGCFYGDRGRGPGGGGLNQARDWVPANCMLRSRQYKRQTARPMGTRGVRQRWGRLAFIGWTDGVSIFLLLCSLVCLLPPPA